MNKDQAEGAWNEFAGQVKAKWGKLTDNDIQRLKGNTQEIYGKMQKEYGLGEEEFKRQLREIQKSSNYKLEDEAAKVIL